MKMEIIIGETYMYIGKRVTVRDIRFDEVVIETVFGEITTCQKDELYQLEKFSSDQ